MRHKDKTGEILVTPLTSNFEKRHVSIRPSVAARLFGPRLKIKYG